MMKNPFQPGDTQQYKTIVTPDKFARFDSGLVHPVLSTFWVAQEAEWVCRLFVLEMIEEGEEGIGGMVSVYHKSPAKENSEVIYTATLTEVIRNKVICSWKAHVKDRLIAEGEQIQKIIHKQDFYSYLQTLE